MGEVVDIHTGAEIGGDLLKDATQKAVDISLPVETELTSTVSRVALMLPWFLKPEDFSKLVENLEDIRKPETQEMSLNKQATNDNYAPELRKQA